MGKRSDFERKPNDYYQTPKEALPYLLRHVEPTTFIEPCAGDGTLVNHLEAVGFTCSYKCDIEPQDESIERKDAFELTREDLFFSPKIITNPPWSRPILHSMIEHFITLAPTWLLFDADWAHTKQAKPYLPYCKKIQAVGRLKWIPDSKYSGKDNAAWYLFTNQKKYHTEFFGR